MDEKRKKLTGAHQIVWNKLRTLPDGERILGVDLQALAGVTQRTLYHIIEDLRETGTPIGASRNDPKGYYELRTDKEFFHFLGSKRKQSKREEEIRIKMEFAWNVKKNTGKGV